jgi:hypothetical protein
MSLLVRLGDLVTFGRVMKGAYAALVAFVGLIVMVFLSALMDTSPLYSAVAIVLWFGFMLAVWWGWRRVDEEVG